MPGNCARENLGLGESRTGFPVHLQYLRIFYQCILWISLKLRLKAVHSNALYSRSIVYSGPGDATLPMGNAIARCAELLIPKQNFTPKTFAGGPRSSSLSRIFERSMRHVRRNVIWAPRLAGLPVKIVYSCLQRKG